MKPVTAMVLCLAVVPIQMQLAGPVTVAGIRPDLPAAAVYAISMALGPWAGGGAGLVVGLLVDRFSGGLVGPQLMAKVFIGVMGGLLTPRLLLATPLAHTGVSFLLFLLQGLWMVALLLWRTGAGWSELYLTALPEACYTAGVVWFGLWLTRYRGPGDRTERLALLLDR